MDWLTIYREEALRLTADIRLRGVSLILAPLGDIAGGLKMLDIFDIMITIHSEGRNQNE